MPIFIIQGRYSHQAIQGMVAHSEDRAPALAKLMESVGGRLLSYYVTFGDNDFHVTVEAPDEKAMLSALAVAGSSQSISALSTTLAVPTSEAAKAFAKAKAITSGFKAAGIG